MPFVGFPCIALWRFYMEGWLDGRQKLREE